MIRGTYFTLSETASILGKNRNTIGRWVECGKVKGQRVGNMVLISEDEVKRLQTTSDS